MRPRSVVLVIASLFALTAGIAYAAHVDEFAYNLPICATNDTGAALTNAPFTATVNADELFDGGFIQNDWADLLAVNPNQQHVELFAQDVATPSADWWIEMDSIAAGQTRCWELHMGSATGSTDQTIYLLAENESVVVPDSAPLDVVSDLTVHALGVTIRDLATGPYFAGGTESQVGQYRVHVFASSATLTLDTPGTVNYLCVGGGGEGGSTSYAGSGTAGGGAAGGQVATGTIDVTSSVAITVGAGGSGVTGGGVGANGATSSIDSLVTCAGGNGGGGSVTRAGQAGYNGSGAGAQDTATSTGGVGTSGNNGGDSTGAATSACGGGGAGSGGTGATAGACPAAEAGDGGTGVSAPYPGTTTTYGCGGGGANSNGGGNAGDAGCSGAGAGASGTNTGSNANANTGSGGGGAGCDGCVGDRSGGNGGSGLVVVWYVRYTCLACKDDSYRLWVEEATVGADVTIGSVTTTVSVATVVEDQEYDFALTYDSSTLDLWVNALPNGNLLSNASYENPTALLNWTSDIGFLTGDQTGTIDQSSLSQQYGTYSALMDLSTIAGPDESQIYGDTASGSFDQYDPVSIGAWLYIPSMSMVEGDFNAYLEFLNVSGTVLSSTSYADVDAGETVSAWTFYSFEGGVAPANASAVRARLDWYSVGAGDVEAYIDGVTVVKAATLPDDAFPEAVANVSGAIDVTANDVEMVGPVPYTVSRVRVIDATAALDDAASTNNAQFESVQPYVSLVGPTDSIGASMRWDHQTNQAIRVVSASSIEEAFDSGGTIEFWVRPATLSDDFRLVFKGQTGSPGLGGWAVRSDATTGAARFTYDFSGAADGSWGGPSGSLAVDTWAHVAVVYDADSVANNPTIYVNGAAVAVTESSAPVGTRSTDGGIDMRFGNRHVGDFPFVGELAEVRLWSDSRTASEIADNYQTRLTGSEAGLVGYWPLDARVLDLGFEPADCEQTQEGNAGNSWTWTGTCADASLHANDGDYTFVRSYMANISVTVEALIAKASLPTVLVTGDIEDVIGTLPDPTGTSAPQDFPGRNSFQIAIDFIDGPDDAAWFAGFAAMGMIVGALMARKTKRDFVGLFAMGVIVGLGGPFGVYGWSLVTAASLACFVSGAGMAAVGVGRRA